MPAAACWASVLVATNRIPGSSQRGWPAHRLADRRSIRRVVLIAPHIGLRPRVRPLTVPRTGSGRRDQPRVMARAWRSRAPSNAPSRTPPSRPSSAALWQRTPKPASGAPRDAASLLHRINSMHPEHGFGQIQPNRCNLLHGWLPSVGVVDNPTLAHRCREGAIPPSSPWASFCRRGIRRQR
jgi:hypothetical protein